MDELQVAVGFYGHDNGIFVGFLIMTLQRPAKEDQDRKKSSGSRRGYYVAG